MFVALVMIRCEPDKVAAAASAPTWPAMHGKR